jgi:hypothetical protein
VAFSSSVNTPPHSHVFTHSTPHAFEIVLLVYVSVWLPNYTVKSL